MYIASIPVLFNQHTVMVFSLQMLIQQKLVWLQVIIY